jgi:hypothetical protein
MKRRGLLEDSGRTQDMVFGFHIAKLEGACQNIGYLKPSIFSGFFPIIICLTIVTVSEGYIK